MRRFIDDKGIFEIKIPSTWKYSLLNERVHTFQDFKAWQMGTFQISFIHLNQETKDGFFHKVRNLTKTLINQISYYSYPDITQDGFTTKTWTTITYDKIVLFSLTIAREHENDINEQISLVRNVISGFKLIEKQKSEFELAWYRLDSFIQGVAATEYMINNAVEHKCFIEMTILFASQIDAFLRIGIILQTQINDKSTAIAKEWIYQGMADKKKTEKDVYQASRALGIIDDNTFNVLHKLYEDRNRVVHRFIISEITASEIEQIALRYYLERERIKRLVYSIESKQIELNLGMTRKGSKFKEDDFHRLIKEKMGGLEYFDKKQSQA